MEISWTHLFPGDHDFVIPLTTKPNSEASLQLSLLKHALAPAPSAVCDRLPPEQVPPGKGHVPQSSQSSGEARKVGSKPWWLAAGCPAASPGAFCSSKTHFWALSSCREYPGTGRGVSTAEELSDPLLCLVLLPPHRISSSVLAQMAPPGSSQTAPSTCSSCPAPSSPSHPREMLTVTSAAVPKPLGRLTAGGQRGDQIQAAAISFEPFPAQHLRF